MSRSQLTQPAPQKATVRGDEVLPQRRLFRCYFSVLPSSTLPPLATHLLKKAR